MDGKAREVEKVGEKIEGKWENFSQEEKEDENGEKNKRNRHNSVTRK